MSEAFSYIWKGFNLALLIILIIWFGGNKIKSAFSSFKSGLTEDFSSSELELKQAQEELNRAKDYLEDSKRRSREQIEITRKTAQNSIEQAKTHAKQIAERLDLKLKQEIEIRSRKAREELALYALKLAKSEAKLKLKQYFEENPQRDEIYIQKALKSIS
ncbi:MAG: hypothetical protein ABDH18_00265 [Aquificaceae bacterium]